MEKGIDEISKLREETNKKIIPYYEQVRQLALPDPSGEKESKIVSNMDKGLTPEEQVVIQKYKLPLPSSILMENIKDKDTVIKILNKSGKINKKLGRKNSKGRKKNEIAEYTEEIGVIQKYRKRIGVIEEGAKT